MSTTLTIIQCRAKVPTAILTHLPEDCLARFRFLKKVCLDLDKAVQGGKKRMELYRGLVTSHLNAQRRPMLSLDRWKKLYEGWSSIERWKGEWTLIDHTLCGGNCSMPSCGNKDRKSLLSQPLIDAWINLAHSNLHTERQSGSLSFESAWRILVKAILDGKTVDGLNNGAPGTWRHLYMRLNPVDANGVPENCPWNEVDVPPGLSLSNFMLRKPRKAETAAKIRGLGALKNHLLPVRVDVSEVPILGCVQIDDVKVNVYVEWTDYETGKTSLVELWALVALDLTSRVVLEFQLHPRIDGEDGKKTGIKRRDMSHLLARIFGRFGFPTKWKCELWVENSAAAITQGLEEDLLLVSDGQIIVHRTSVHAQKLLPDCFGQRAGSPKGKAHVESFHRRFAIEAGYIQGQTGGRYFWKPGETEPRRELTERILNQLGELATPSERQELTFHESVESVKGHILEVLHRMENNPLHELQGFAKVSQWRYSAKDTWKPMDHHELQAMMTELGLPHVNRFLEGEHRRDLRNETVRERWTRLYNSADFLRLPFESIALLWMDRTKEPIKYEGLGFISVTLEGKRTFEFRGIGHRAKAGDWVHVRFDADTPELGCVLCDLTGVPLGKMEFKGRNKWGDTKARIEDFRMQQLAENSVLDELTRREWEGQNGEAKLARQKSRVHGVTTILDRAKNEAAGNAQAKAVMDTFETGRTEGSDLDDAEEISSAAAYLAGRK